jgi:hypothetical protein
MPSQSLRPGLVNALHLFWLFLLMLAPIVISQLLYSALD